MRSLTARGDRRALLPDGASYSGTVRTLCVCVALSPPLSANAERSLAVREKHSSSLSPEAGCAKSALFLANYYSPDASYKPSHLACPIPSLSPLVSHGPAKFNSSCFLTHITTTKGLKKGRSIL